MKYSQLVNLSDDKFLAEVGVSRESFQQMAAILQRDMDHTHAHGGRPIKGKVEEILYAVLQYDQGKGTYMKLVADLQMHKTSLIRRTHWARSLLVAHGISWPVTKKRAKK